MNNYSKGIFTGIISVFFISTYSIFGKILLLDINPETLIIITQAISGLTILLFFGFVPELKKIYKLPKKDIIWLVTVAILSAVIAPLCLLKGLQVTSATNSVIIGRLEPVFAGIISIIWLKECVTKKHIFGALLMFFGISLIVTKGFNSAVSLNYGDIFVIVSAFSWALATNIFKKEITHIPAEIVVLFRNFIGAIIVLTLIPLIIGTEINFEISSINNLYLYIIALSIITILMGQLLWYKTLELIPASKASTIGFLAPLFGVFLAVTVLNENLYQYHIYGGVLVLIGLFLTILQTNTHPLNYVLEKIRHNHQ